MILFCLFTAALVCAQTTTPRSTTTNTVLSNTTSARVSSTTVATSAATTTLCRPGVAPCVCDTGMRCYSGVCQENMCINVRNATCEPAPDSAHPDVCILYDQEFGTGFCCQGGACKSCTVGARHCPCLSNGACSSRVDKCEPFGPKNRTRCFPRTGCVGCPCVPVTNACDDGLCMSGVCVVPTTTTTTTLPAPATMKTIGGCPAADFYVWSSCDSVFQSCLTKVAKANGTRDDFCKCSVAYVACYFARPAACDLYNTSATKILDYCRSVVNCSSCEPTQPPPPNLACEAARVQQGSMCLYPGSMRDDTSRLVMAAQVGVISAVTMRICASLRAYLACSRRILEAGTCDASSVDIVYYPSLGGPTYLCSYNKTAALLKDIECDMCTALSEPPVPGVSSFAPGSTGSIVATNDVSAGERLASVCGVLLAVVVCLAIRMTL
jgi:hypothetical protein